MTDWVVSIFDIELTAKSGIRVGGPREESSPHASLMDVQAPVLRDNLDRPIIPGSSLKGVLRSSAERFLRAHHKDLACDILADSCVARLKKKDKNRKEEDLKPDESCWVCRLFGNTAYGGRVFVGDLAADDALTIVRDGVAISRETLAQDSKRRAKFDYEVAAPGTVFKGTIRIDDPEPGDEGLVLALLDLMNHDLMRVGGGTTRGLGMVESRVTRVKTWSASTWKPEAAPEESEHMAMVQAFADRLASLSAKGRE
jgi:CRISPR-associated protein Csm3